jgi:hypothetical protein
MKTFFLKSKKEIAFLTALLVANLIVFLAVFLMARFLDVWVTVISAFAVFIIPFAVYELVLHVIEIWGRNEN